MKILLCIMVLVAVGLVIFCLMFAASRMSRLEERWLHPPDDDDGVSILRDDDPDGDCTR